MARAWGFNKPRRILILGGARSGKSRFAQELASSLGQRVLFVAPAAPLDEEMGRRIETHRGARPLSWRTLEVNTDIAGALPEQAGDAEVVILDCVTLLISNLAGEEGQGLEEKAIAEVRGLLAFMESSRAHFILVSNEVGMGIVPSYPLGRLYRDALGSANQELARRMDEVYVMFAGIPLPLKGFFK